MTGHAQGAAGALEAIFCLLMLKDDFIAPSINVETLDPALKPEEIATDRGECRPRHRHDQLLRLRRHQRFDAAQPVYG
jgi:3-oxoacyl-(acyl-carrier-protein) synthase